MIDPKQIGQGREFNTATAAYDAKAGVYHDAVVSIPTEAKLPTQQLPMAPMTKPFDIKGG